MTLTAVSRTILQPFGGAPIIVGPLPYPFTYNVVVVDADFGYDTCAGAVQPTGAWLSDAFGSPCIVVEQGSR